jgi:hypothetical protein
MHPRIFTKIVIRSNFPPYMHPYSLTPCTHKVGEPLQFALASPLVYIVLDKIQQKKHVWKEGHFPNIMLFLGVFRKHPDPLIQTFFFAGCCVFGRGEG